MIDEIGLNLVERIYFITRAQLFDSALPPPIFSNSFHGLFGEVYKTNILLCKICRRHPVCMHHRLPYPLLVRNCLLLALSNAQTSQKINILMYSFNIYKLKVLTKYCHFNLYLYMLSLSTL